MTGDHWTLKCPNNEKIAAGRMQKIGGEGGASLGGGEGGGPGSLGTRCKLATCQKKQENQTCRSCSAVSDQSHAHTLPRTGKPRLLEALHLLPSCVVRMRSVQWTGWLVMVMITLFCKSSGPSRPHQSKHHSGTVLMLLSLLHLCLS